MDAARIISLVLGVATAVGIIIGLWKIARPIGLSILKYVITNIFDIFVFATMSIHAALGLILIDAGIMNGNTYSILGRLLGHITLAGVGFAAGISFITMATALFKVKGPTWLHTAVGMSAWSMLCLLISIAALSLPYFNMYLVTDEYGQGKVLNDWIMTGFNPTVWNNFETICKVVIVLVICDYGFIAIDAMILVVVFAITGESSYDVISWLNESHLFQEPDKIKKKKNKGGTKAGKNPNDAINEKVEEDQKEFEDSLRVLVSRVFNTEGERNRWKRTVVSQFNKHKQRQGKAVTDKIQFKAFDIIDKVGKFDAKYSEEKMKKKSGLDLEKFKQDKARADRALYVEIAEFFSNRPIDEGLGLSLTKGVQNKLELYIKEMNDEGEGN